MYNPQYVPCTEGSDEMVAVLLNLSPDFPFLSTPNKSVREASSGPSLPNGDNINVSNIVERKNSPVYTLHLFLERRILFNTRTTEQVFLQ